MSRIASLFMAPDGYMPIGGTFDPEAKNGHITLSGGNLVAAWDGIGAANDQVVKGTIYKSSGKWLARFAMDILASAAVGIETLAASVADFAYIGSDSNGYGYYKNATKAYNGVIEAYGNAWVTGDVVDVLVDLDDGTISFLLNGSSQGIAYTGISGTFAMAMGVQGATTVTANFDTSG